MHPYLSVPGNRSVEDSVHAQNGRLRWVDDGCSEEGPEYTSIADGEGAAIHILDGQRPCAGLLTKCCNATLNVQVVHSFHVAQHWHHEALK